MRNAKSYQRWSTAFALAFWMLVLAVGVLSLMPVDKLPPPLINWWDKAQHAFGFAGMAILGFAAYAARTLAVTVWLAFYGAFIEVAQWGTGWRYGDFLDWIADLTGIVLALVAMHVIRKYWTSARVS